MNGNMWYMDGYEMIIFKWFKTKIFLDIAVYLNNDLCDIKVAFVTK